MQRHDDLNVPMMAYWGVFSCIVTFALILAIQVAYYRVANAENERKVVSAVYTDSESILAAQDAKLVRYGWLSREEGRVAIPIERAMDLVVQEGVSVEAAGPPASQEAAP
jgi:hypothetical protein